MAYDVKILLDSVNPAGVRLVTWELTYPRFVHAELMTHRVFSRSSASSRAIPYKKMRDRIIDDPVCPVWWGKNQAGMQALEEFEGEEAYAIERKWLDARMNAVFYADRLSDAGLHKQIVNRVVEPWMWITVIMTTTYHSNWFEQRDHKDAQPELRHFAAMMHDAYWAQRPRFLPAGSWHMPLLPDRDKLVSEGFKDVGPTFAYDPDSSYAMSPLNVPMASFDGTLQAISAGRCARVSYLNHDGKRDPNEDIKLFQRMAGNNPAHRAPLEHVALSMGSHPKVVEELSEDVCGLARYGNFQGFKQLRHFVPNEAGPPEPRFDASGECVNYDPVSRKPRAA